MPNFFERMGRFLGFVNQAPKAFDFNTDSSSDNPDPENEEDLRLVREQAKKERLAKNPYYQALKAKIEQAKQESKHQDSSVESVNNEDTSSSDSESDSDKDTPHTLKISTLPQGTFANQKEEDILRMRKETINEGFKLLNRKPY